MLRTWLNKLRLPRSGARKPLRCQACFRPSLEALEDRAVPTILAVPSSTYPTITAAINAANSGDIINVNPGTYQEQVVIPAKGANGKAITSLQLNSLGAVQPGPTQSSPMAIILAPTSLTTGNQPIVDVNGATGVSINSFEISGQTSGTKVLAGVYVEGNGSAKVFKDWITQLQTSNDSGVGVLVGNTKSRLNNTTGAKGTGTVTDSIIDHYGKAGVAVVNGSTGTVNNNTITGSGTSSPVIQYGVEMGSFQGGDGAGGSITNNNITGNLSFDTTGSFQAAGILMYNAGTVTSISNNNLGTNAHALPNGTTVPFSNDVGIWIFSLSGTTISNNNIAETKYDGMVFDEVNTVNSGLNVSNNNVSYSLGDGMLIYNTTSSTFTNNNSTNNGQSGFWLALNVTKSAFKQDNASANGTFGILVADYDPNSPTFEGYLHSSTSTGNTISQSNFTGNDTSLATGVYDAEDFSVDSKTAGTANTWSGSDNIGTKNPPGL